MKKTIITLLLILFLVGCTNTKNNDVTEPKKDNKNSKQVVVNLFHWNQCSHCKEEIIWLKELVERNDYIKVNYYEVTENEDLVALVRTELSVLGDGVPLTVIGTDYILGFGDSTKARMMNVIDKYKDKDYCDIVSLIIAGEDTTECYLQNE